MNGLNKVVFRLANMGSASVMRSAFGKRDFTRTLWHMSKTPEHPQTGMNVASVLNLHKPSLNCKCGCNVKFTHSKSERELVEFLTEEILAERKAQKGKPTPSNLDGFKVAFDGADIEMTKDCGNEKIVVSFNVNHTVSTEDDPELDPNADKPDISEMRSKPRFEVDVIKGKTTLSFTCSFLEGPPQEGEYNDIFGIDEMSIFDSEWNDKVYAVAGEVLDNYLYDLLMNLLEEKGVSNEFVEKLSDLATSFEHASYVNLLEKLSKFSAAPAKE